MANPVPRIKARPRRFRGQYPLSGAVRLTPPPPTAPLPLDGNAGLKRSLACSPRRPVSLRLGSAGGASGLARRGRETASGGTAVAVVFPVTLTDDGAPGHRRQPPARIASLAPSNDGGARPGRDRVRARHLPRLPLGGRAVSGRLAPDPEAIVALQPDLVLGIWASAADVIAALEG